MFGPNIVIDSEESNQGAQNGMAFNQQAYCEEEIQHAKLKDGAYLQLIGPCIRSKTTSMNWNKGDPSLEEPYQTI